MQAAAQYSKKPLIIPLQDYKDREHVLPQGIADSAQNGEHPGSEKVCSTHQCQVNIHNNPEVHMVSLWM